MKFREVPLTALVMMYGAGADWSPQTLYMHHKYAELRGADTPFHTSPYHIYMHTQNMQTDVTLDSTCVMINTP